MNDKQEYIDVTIIGAGVVGLAVAAATARSGRSLYIIEKNKKFGQETSSRNSEVIHAGLYYPPGSLKARTCITGNRMLYEICPKHNIPHRRITKIVVATSEEEEEALNALAVNAGQNEVEGLEILDRQQLKSLEPYIEARAALFVPSTGIIDSHRLMEYYLYTARSRGAEIVYHTEVKAIEPLAKGYLIKVHTGGEEFSFVSRVVVNCAGLYSDRIAAMVGIDIDAVGYRLHYCKGEYFSVAARKARLVSRLIYPLPHTHITGLGLHITLGLDGRMRIGPSAFYVPIIDYTVDENNLPLFYQSASRYFPLLEPEDLAPEMAGIRPKLQGPGEPVRDFVIRHEFDRGLPGLINLIGIESPGLTASPAIGAMVAAMVNEYLS